MSRFNVYQVDDALSLALSLSLSLKLLFTYALTHLPIIHPPTHSILHSLTLFLSLSLSGVYVRAFVRVPLSFVLSLSPLHSLSGCLSVSLFLFYTRLRTRSHTLSLIHSLTNAHTHRIIIPIFLAHSHTFLSLSLFLSPSLSLPLSLSYTRTLIYTHIRTHTLSHLFTRSSTHSLLSHVRAALSSARVRARALCSLFLSPFLPFFFFSLAILSLSSLPPLSLACFLAIFLSLVRFLSFPNPGSHDFNLKQSCSHCESTLSLPCP